VLTGFLSGIVATIVMTLTEIPSWKKWGLHGVFEWHENQILSRRFLNIQNRNKVHFKAVFFLHFLNGVLAGIAYPFIIPLFEFLNIGSIPVYLLRISYGFVLWMLTLVPIHKPITGLSPWNHPLGHLPVIASLGGHIVYGFILVIMYITIIHG
jgi:hypothetical protein